MARQIFMKVMCYIHVCMLLLDPSLSFTDFATPLITYLEFSKFEMEFVIYVYIYICYNTFNKKCRREIAKIIYRKKQKNNSNTVQLTPKYVKKRQLTPKN